MELRHSMCGRLPRACCHPLCAGCTFVVPRLVRVLAAQTQLRPLRGGVGGGGGETSSPIGKGCNLCVMWLKRGAKSLVENPLMEAGFGCING